jgi:hypothetical protein
MVSVAEPASLLSSSLLGGLAAAWFRAGSGAKYRRPQAGPFRRFIYFRPKAFYGRAKSVGHMDYPQCRSLADSSKNSHFINANKKVPDVINSLERIRVRVGLWIADILDAAGIRATVALNAMVCDVYPKAVRR